ACAGATDRRRHVPLRLGPPVAIHAPQARGRAGGLPRARGPAGGARSAAGRAGLDSAAAPVHGLPPAGGGGVDRGAPRGVGGLGHGATAAAAVTRAALRVRLDRAPDRCAPLRISELRRGMTAGPSPFAGLRVVLVAAFNRRYHRSGLALAAALAAFGCEVRRRGWNAVFGRSLVARLTARLRRGPVDVVLVFKGAGLAPADVADLRRRFGGRWVNWFPDDPHQLELSSRLAPAYDCFFTHDSASLAGHRAAGA